MLTPIALDIEAAGDRISALMKTFAARYYWYWPR